MEKINEQTENKEKYSLDWFRERAFSSLKKVSEGVFDYSDSLLLYIPRSDEEYEKIQHEGNPYHEMITAPERKYLLQIMKDVVARLPENFEYLDLGPGSEHKEQYVFDQILEQGKKCVYRPVDISEKFLNKAAERAEKQGIPVEPVRASFEELPNVLQKSNIPRFVSLGLTYSNYDPQEILKLLADIAGSNGYVFIEAQIRERIDIKRLVEIYAKDSLSVTTAKLKLLGLDAEVDVEDLHANEDIQMWCTLKKVTPRLTEVGLKAGDKILLFQSLRPSIDKLKRDLDEAGFSDYTMLDVGESFVGVLLERPLQKEDEEK
ncbi:MAG: L-histidine N(alpha)-methyltransferase [Candidatus Zambryskibacteria bacterium]|nr:L-histidine N(alpha)-methyltransferase [Candidatus Zambryskibacteria bacterium]